MDLLLIVNTIVFLVLTHGLVNQIVREESVSGGLNALQVN